jgi:hypothetical protein
VSRFSLKKCLLVLVQFLAQLWDCCVEKIEDSCARLAQEGHNIAISGVVETDIGQTQPSDALFEDGGQQSLNGLDFGLGSSGMLDKINNQYGCRAELTEIKQRCTLFHASTPSVTHHRANGRMATPPMNHETAFYPHKNHKQLTTAATHRYRVWPVTLAKLTLFSATWRTLQRGADGEAVGWRQVGA